MNLPSHEPACEAITVNSLCLSWVSIPMINGEELVQVRNERADAVPLGRTATVSSAVQRPVKWQAVDRWLMELYSIHKIIQSNGYSITRIRHPQKAIRREGHILVKSSPL